MKLAQEGFSWRNTRLTAMLVAAMCGQMATPASANEPPIITPMEPVVVRVGETLSQRVEPLDPEGVVPSLQLLDWKGRISFDDNRDGTRTLRWTPAARDVGRHRFRFRAIDAEDANLVGERALDVTVVEGSSEPGSGNAAPVIEPLNVAAIEPGGSFNFAVAASDPDGDVPSLYYEPWMADTEFRDNGNGTRQFVWTPPVGARGTTFVEFVAADARDGNIKSSQLVALTINGSGPGVPVEPPPPIGNQLPDFPFLDNQMGFLGTTIEFNVRPIDPDGGVPGMYIQSLPVGARWIDQFDGSRNFSWYPVPNDLGKHYLTFIAFDAQYPNVEVSKTIELTIARDPNNPVNFPPVINGIHNPVIRVGDTLQQWVQPVDPDGVVPALIATSIPADAEFVDNGDGTRDVVWTPRGRDIGDHTMSFLTIDSEDPSLRDTRDIVVSVKRRSDFEREGERLKTLAAARGIELGTAVIINSDELADVQLYEDVMLEEFGMITPENSQKMSWVHPSPDRYRLEDADRLAEFAVNNGLKLHGHPLIWYAQLPPWVQQLDPSEAERVMLEHIDLLVGRYKGKVALWDVVNEALEDDGRLRNSIWYQGMGEDYITKAFRHARQVDPAASLIYNDYDVLWQNDKSDAMYQMVKRELAKGTPIDGVGFQSHVYSTFDQLDSARANLQRFADLGLDIWITEFDVSLVEGVSKDQALADQARVYEDVMHLCLEQPACKGVQNWGFTDRYSWRKNQSPLLFDDAYQPKPAYFAWQKALSD